MQHSLQRRLKDICSVSKRVGAYEHHPRSAEQRARKFGSQMLQLGYRCSYLSWQHGGVGAYDPGLAYNVMTGAWNQPGTLWISAHHDYCGGLGAADNGTGLAVMLEVAAQLPREQRNSVAFTSFGFEEQSLGGSKNFVENYSDTVGQIGGFLNLECLGVQDWQTVIVTRRLRRIRSDKQLVKLMRRANPNYRPMICPEVFTGDSIPFQRAGVPVVELMGYPTDGATNPIHTAADLPEGIDFGEVETVVNTILKFVEVWTNGH